MHQTITTNLSQKIETMQLQADLQLYILISIISLSLLAVFFTVLNKSNICKVVANPLETKPLFVPEKVLAKEAYIIFKLSLQVGLMMVFEVCVPTVSTIFIGHLPNSAQILSATAIAMSFTIMFPLCLSFGFCGALWTLIPQAIGSNKFDLIGLYVQRAIMISFIIEIPLSILLFNGGYILSEFKIIHLVESGDVPIDIVTNYCRALIPYPYLLIALSCLHRAAQNLNFNFQLLIIHCITFFLSIPLNYLFVITFQFGYIGCAITINLIFILNIIMTCLLLIRNGFSFIINPLPLNTLITRNGIIQYFQLGFPAMIQITLSWIIRESVIILSGFVPSLNPAITVSSTNVMKQFNRITLLHHGIANASSMRIGKYIGANCISLAKRCILIQVCYEFSLIMLVAVLTVIYKKTLPTFFTNNDEIISSVIKLIYIALFNQFSMAAYIHLTAIYRALGYQKITAYMIFISQYLLAFPVQFYLIFFVFVSNGIYIIWLGRGFGYLIADILIVFVLIYYVDWHKAFIEGQKRLTSDETSVHASATHANDAKHKNSLV